VTIRVHGGVERHRCARLEQALDLLEAELRAARIREPAQRQALGRSYAPSEQVAARGEIAGPARLRGGVDVRGDGTTQAFTGRAVRRAIDGDPREDAYAALRRALTD
jgi:hypothetical protein